MFRILNFAADNRLVVARQSLLLVGKAVEDGAPLAVDAGTMIVLVMKPGPPPPAAVQLSIKPFEGTAAINLDCSPDDTIGKVKAAFGVHVGRAAKFFYYAGKILEDTVTLRSYNLMGPFHEISELENLRGGA